MPDQPGALWRVKNWNEVYENHHSRPLKSLSWLRVPLDLGDGYAEILDHPEGTAHFGVWMAILMIAAKSEPRGTLRRGAGIPHTCASIARESRAEARLVADAIPRLMKIGWLEDISNDCNATRDSRAEANFPRANPAIEEKRLEEKRLEEKREEKEEAHALFSICFDRHRKNRGTETRLQVARILAGVDWGEFDARHRPYCEYWDRHGWNVCPVSMLEWWRNGMPLPPPEAVLRSSPAQRETKAQEMVRVANERVLKTGRL